MMQKELPFFVVDGKCRNGGAYPCALGYSCDTCPYNKVVQQKDCPFPELLCSQCPLSKIKLGPKSRRQCIWKEVIKPTYKKERLGYE